MRFPPRRGLRACSVASFFAVVAALENFNLSGHRDAPKRCRHFHPAEMVEPVVICSASESTQDYAALMGAIALFIVSAIVMYVTRKVDWYARDAS
jgi:Inner membrane protein CreD